MTELLDNFLQLLSIAEEWDMPSLRDKITMEIVDNCIIERLPQEFPTSQLLSFFFKKRVSEDNLFFLKC